MRLGMPRQHGPERPDVLADGLPWHGLILGARRLQRAEMCAHEAGELEIRRPALGSVGSEDIDGFAQGRAIDEGLAVLEDAALLHRDEQFLVTVGRGSARPEREHAPRDCGARRPKAPVRCRDAGADRSLLGVVP